MGAVLSGGAKSNNVRLLRLQGRTFLAHSGLCRTSLYLSWTVLLRFVIDIPARYIDEQKHTEARMWADAHRDGRPAEHRWRALFNAAKFG